MPKTNLFKLSLTLLLLTAFAGLASGQRNKGKSPEPYSRLYEIEQLMRVDQLPVYRSGIVEQVSSYDPTGGNEDGFAGIYSYIREEEGKLVLAELEGPGVINRIWTPTPTADTLEFYFDGEAVARLRICFDDLFNGKVYPFVKPVCGNEVGGYYCYIPIPYEKSLKITFSGKRIQFHQIQYRNLAGYDVKSWTNDFTGEERRALDEVCSVWANINPQNSDYSKGKSSSGKLMEKDFTLMPGDDVAFFRTDVAGRITGFEIDGGNSFEGFEKDVMIYAKWDDDSAPAIEAPLADFFGYAFGKKAMRSMLIGCRGDVNYCYMPAPFDKNAELRLKYVLRDGAKQNPVQVNTKVYFAENKREPAKEGKLYTSWRREINPADGEYYKFLSKEGKGHYVGTVQLAQGFLAEMTEFFEGDDSTYVDGKMRIHGTGSEDYFNGGWYAMLDRWDRGVSLALHGALDYSLPMARTGGYRFYMNDKLTFNDYIYMGIEHGPEGNKYPVDYASVAYFYSDSPSTENMKATEQLRTVYIPREHNYYPQAMRLSMGNNVRVFFGDYPRGNIITSRGTGLVRVLLEDVPEGIYDVYFDYYEHSKGAEFSVWQRQEMLTDWRSSEGADDTKIGRFHAGRITLTPQSNSISFRIRGENYTKQFEFANIYLVRVD